MRAGLVVVTHVAVEDTSRVAFVHNKEKVGALFTDRPHPALSDGVRPRCIALECGLPRSGRT